ncbi:hypothetical protein F5141DRAFT_1217396 [Pisolithus sp. B1]|nr:hypothetical protein F5141DRAFT_1217396 [Pisolithus sp. B1]
MSTDISDLGLPFCGEVIGFNAESLKENTTPASESLELAFEFHDPVPPYHPASEEVLKVVNDTIKSPQAKSELQKAIRDLGDSAHSIEVCFNNIADDLRKAQMQGTDAQKQQLKTFANNWAICHKVKFPWSTFASCGNRVALPDMLVQLQMMNEAFSLLSPLVSYFFVLDFAGDFINLMTASNVTLPEKKQEIQAYRKQLQEDVKKSSNLSQGFYDLRNAADQFQRDVLAFLRPDHKLESRVETLKDNLGKIRREIDQFVYLLHLVDSSTYRTGFHGLTKRGFLDATALVGLGGMAAGGFAVGVLCPLLWIGAAVFAYRTFRKGADIVRTMRERKEKTAELEMMENQLEEQEKAMKGIRKIDTILDPLKSGMELIKEKLVVFGKIWQLIHTDLNKIERCLELATSSAGARMFQRRLETISTIYHALTDALYEYETNVQVRNTAKLKD